MFCNLPVLLVFLAIDLGNAIPTENRMIYFYDGFVKTWNDANELCRRQGFTMIKMDSRDVQTGLLELYNGKLMRYWIGLRDTDDRPDEETYMWSDGTSLGAYRPWRAQYLRHVRRCVYAKLSDNTDISWTTEDCSSDQYVICQQIAGQCSFELQRDMSADNSTDTIEVDASDESECIQNCREHDSPECWGFEMTNQVCVIYLAESYTKFTSKLIVAPSKGITKKFCFQGVTDSRTESELVPKTTELTETTTTTAVPDDTSTVEVKTTTVETTTTPQGPERVVKTTARPSRKPKFHQKQKYVYLEIKDKKNFRVTSTPDWTVRAYHSVSCATKCRPEKSGCVVVNYNSRTRQCKGFSSRDLDGVCDEGWTLWKAVLQQV